MKTRRQFLLGSAAIAGGFVVGCRFDGGEPTGRQLAGEVELNPYVKIDQQGVTIITPRAEMGQGIHTTLAALVAEKLDVALEEVRVEHGPASDVYRNTVFFGTEDRPGSPSGQPTQATGGQTSIRDGFVKMRQAGAAARAMLVAAAAERLGVDASDLSTREGKIVDGRGGEIPYTELAVSAASFEPPAARSDSATA